MFSSSSQQTKLSNFADNENCVISDDGIELYRRKLIISTHYEGFEQKIKKAQSECCTLIKTVPSCADQLKKIFGMSKERDLHPVLWMVFIPTAMYLI